MKLKEFINVVTKFAEDENVNDKQIQGLVHAFFMKLPIQSAEMRNMFVVRCSMNADGEIFTTAKRCSYPPSELIPKIERQRSNYPGQQVFYCSIPSDTDFAAASVTCIVETAWEYIEDLSSAKRYATLSKWNCSRPLNLRILPFYEKSCQRNRSMNELRAKSLQDLYRMYANPTPIIKALEFISEAFCIKENKALYYRITSAFFNAFVNNNTKFDGLVYPSANTDGAGLNLALQKRLIDDRIIQFDRAIMYCLKRNPKDPNRLSLLPCSEDALPSSDGKLVFVPTTEYEIY